MDEILRQILDELRFQSRVIEKQFNLLSKITMPCDKKLETPKIPPELMEMMNGLMPFIKGTPMEKVFSKFTNDLKEKKDGN